jgi:membrane-associated protease RseP (regulator of RpoE activity)
MNDLIQRAQKIISNRLTLDYFSRFSGTIIFRADKKHLDRSELDQILQSLFNNGIFCQVQETENEYLLRLFEQYSKVRKERWWINLLLFIITFASITFTGRFLYFANWSHSLAYAISLMIILTAHELGHYFYAMKHRMHATLPYFIPFPQIFGTLGAFIKMKSPIPHKKALLDVGIAGPLAGFVFSIFFLILGFADLPGPEGVKEYVSQIHEWVEETDGTALTLGTTILFEFTRNLFGADYLPMYEIYHFPFIFSAWIGLLVTAINLMPIGQLDGGHISYALLGKRARFVAIGAFIALALLNFYSTNWLLWTILILFVIRLKHPPTMNDQEDLDKNRKILAWSSYLIFITCFPPMPIYFS